MKYRNMTKEEKSLLLFLETRAVDYGGRVNTLHMNGEDFDIAKRWDEEGFVGFGRIVARNHNSDGSHWVKLSDEAWKLAHKERKARAKRMWDNKTWLSTKDSMEMHGHPHCSGMNKPPETSWVEEEK